MDKELETRLKKAFSDAGIPAATDGPYVTGKLPENICNRNRRGKGVQIEVSRGIRDNAKLRKACVEAIRSALKAGV